MADIQKTKTEENVTLTVSTTVSSELTEAEQRDILVRFISLSHDLYRELCMKIVGDSNIFLPRPDGENVLEHFGLAPKDGTSIFESSKLAELFLVLSSTVISAPRRFVVDFDPAYPYSVLREMGISITPSEH